MKPIPLPEQDLREIVSACHPVWGHIRGARLLITGGTGFVGRWMIESILAANRALDLGVHVHALSRNISSFAPLFDRERHETSLNVWEGDLLASRLPQFPQPITHVIHAAGEVDSSQAESNWDSIIHERVRAYEWFTEKMILKEPAVRQLYLSSGSVYGSAVATPAREDSLQYPDRVPEVTTLYAKIKQGVEPYFLSLGGAARVARGFSFIGPGLGRSYAGGDFIARGARGEDVVLRSAGQAVRSYLYASDMTAILWKIFLTPEPVGAVNVGDSREVTVRELADQIAAAAGVAVRLEENSGAPRGLSGEYYVPCTKKMETFQTPWTSLSSAIQKTLKWCHES